MPNTQTIQILKTENEQEAENVFLSEIERFLRAGLCPVCMSNLSEDNGSQTCKNCKTSF